MGRRGAAKSRACWGHRGLATAAGHRDLYGRHTIMAAIPSSPPLHRAVTGQPRLEPHLIKHRHHSVTNAAKACARRALGKRYKSEPDLITRLGDPKRAGRSSLGIIGETGAPRRHSALSLSVVTKMKMLALRGRQASDASFDVYSYGGPAKLGSRRGRAGSLAENTDAIRFQMQQRQRHKARRARRKKATEVRKASALVRNEAFRKVDERQTRPVSWALDSNFTYNDLVQKATADIMRPRYFGMYATKQNLKQRFRSKSLSRAEYRRRDRNAAKNFQDEKSNVETLCAAVIKEGGRTLWQPSPSWSGDEDDGELG